MLLHVILRQGNSPEEPLRNTCPELSQASHVTFSTEKYNYFWIAKFAINYYYNYCFDSFYPPLSLQLRFD